MKGMTLLYHDPPHSETFRAARKRRRRPGGRKRSARASRSSSPGQEPDGFPEFAGVFLHVHERRDQAEPVLRGGDARRTDSAHGTPEGRGGAARGATEHSLGRSSWDHIFVSSAFSFLRQPFFGSHKKHNPKTKNMKYRIYDLPLFYAKLTNYLRFIDHICIFQMTRRFFWLKNSRG
ncbi:MAG: hypothetical protein IKI84_11995 [Clostridia bacterium]|nr:hypothetical protein [Clostridia bacterium]